MSIHYVLVILLFSLAPDFMSLKFTLWSLNIFQTSQERAEYPVDVILVLTVQFKLSLRFINRNE